MKKIVSLLPLLLLSAQILWAQSFGSTLSTPTSQQKPVIKEEAPANITLKITDDLGYDADDEEITETALQLHLGALKEGTAIQIDWGDGEKRDYTIGSKDPANITETIDGGATVKIYGELSLLDATGNKTITEAHFSKTPALQVLRLAQNKLTAIDLSELTALKELWLTDNKLTAIDLSSLTNLEEFYGAWNNYPELKTHMNTKLTVLTCYNTAITALDLSHNKALEVLTAGANKYTNPLDLSQNTALKSLDLEGAGLPSIDVTPLVRLSKLNMQGNQLTALDISQNKALRLLDLRANPIDACTLNDIYFLLPKAEEVDEARAYINKTTGGATSETAMLTNKGWKVDIKGDATGCSTVRLLCLPVDKGTFTTEVDGKIIPSWTPITKGDRVTVTAKPNQPNYIARVLLNDMPIEGNSFEADKYMTVTVVFLVEDALEEVVQGATIHCTEKEIYAEGLLPNASYQVYDVAGLLLAEGTTNAYGALVLPIERGEGLLLIRQGATIIKAIR